MSLAFRRTLLYPPSSTRCALRIYPHPWRNRLPAVNRVRSFHASSTRWKNADPETEAPVPKRKRGRPPKNPVVEVVETEETASEKMEASSVPQIKDVFEQEAFLEEIAESGDVDASLEKFGLDPNELQDSEKSDLIEMAATFKKIKELDEEEDRLDRLARDFVDHKGAIGTLDEVVREAGIDPDELTEEATDEEKRLLKESGVDYLEGEPDEALEKASLDAFAGTLDGDESEELDEAEDLVEDENDEEGNLTAEEQTMLQDQMKGLKEYMDGIDEMADIEVSDKQREKVGFFNDNKDDDCGPDEVFNQDDLPASGHLELDLQREVREYSRLMVWELPLLSKLARPFTPPAADQLLRFRYTTYMGEQHPAEKKVVVSFSPSHQFLELTSTERSKLIKLAGVRYNPSTDQIKMSCETFDTPAQNKRYLGDLVEILLKEAKDAKDTLADIPFDFRHHKPKPEYTFPKSWILTPERRAELLAARAKTSVADPVDGLLHVPDGQLIRDREARRAEVEKSEQFRLDSDNVKMEVKEMVLAAREQRAIAEGLQLKVDQRTRRPSKRGKISPLLELDATKSSERRI